MVCVTVKDMVFKQLSLEYGKEIREFRSRVGYYLPGNSSVVRNEDSKSFWKIGYLECWDVWCLG